jgi:hypothetical protein
MTPRRRSALGMREARTQEALVAALRVRPRTAHRAAQCSRVAEVSSFSRLVEHQWCGRGAVLVAQAGLWGRCAQRRRP